MTPNHNAVETLFLRRWESIDFSTWNEQAVREEFLIELLHILGYRKGTSHDIEMEKPLRLAEPFHQVGRKRVAIDYAPSFRLRYFWIIEAKPGNQPTMTFADLLQVHLYAIHPEIQARFIVLSNGREVRVYDALTLKSFDDALLVVTQQDCFVKFAELRDMLGAETMLPLQRRHLLDMLQRTLDVELDIEGFRAFTSEVHTLLRAGEERIRQNIHDLRSQRLRKWEGEEQKELQAASIPVLFVRMDLPEDSRPIAAEEFVRRVCASDETERQRLVEQLAMHYRGRVHTIFRGLSVYVLARLLREGVQVKRSSYVSGLVPALEELVRANANYWQLSPSINALCHLDNAAMRVAYKFCAKVGAPFLVQIAKEGHAAMSVEDRAAQPVSLASLMVPSVGHAQEILWRKWCSKGRDQVLSGLWALQCVEEELEHVPTRGYPNPDESDLMFFEHQGIEVDQLRVSSWNCLRKHTAALRDAGAAPDVVAFAEQPWANLKRGIPLAPTRPHDFAPEWALKDLVQELLPHVVGLRAAAVLEHVR